MLLGYGNEHNYAIPSRRARAREKEKDPFITELSQPTDGYASYLYASQKMKKQRGFSYTSLLLCIDRGCHLLSLVEI